MSYMRMLLAIVLTGLAFPAEVNAGSAGEAPMTSAPTFADERNAEIDASIARVEVARMAEFQWVRNREIDAASAASAQAKFNRERNEEIEASFAAVANELARETKEAQELEFVSEQNRLAEASMARVTAIQSSEFARERNQEIESASSASEAARFAEQRNAEIERSLAAVAAARQEEQFAAARNSEIALSISAVDGSRHQLETGSIRR